MNPSTGSYKFAIDFTPVREIPENPKDRLSYFTAFKNLLKSEKEKIQAWHRTGIGGREVIQANTALIDEVIRHLIVSLNSLKRYSGAGVLEEIALVAVGGYGRGELNPCSDIDLLFLKPPKISKTADEFIQDLISIFWGIGMEIGHSCRSIKECVKLANEDLTIKTSMIETRLLIGNRERYEMFCHSVKKNVLKKQIRFYLDSKLTEKYECYRAEDGLVCVQEPDIKDGPGGLRDYHTALWATAVRFGCLSIREIGRNDMISNEEIDSLYESVNFLLRVRNELHYLVGKKTDLLSLDIQKDLARNLGYEGERDAVRVEKFMKDYFLHATTIYNASHIVFELCRQPKVSIKKVISSFTRKPLGDGFHTRDALLVMDGDAGEKFRRDRSLMLKLFLLCRQHDLKPEFQLKRQIRLNRHLLDAQFLKQARVKDFLFSFLEDSRSRKYLRQMHETEVLGQILPEFGKAHCVVSYDFYHQYTADEHSLRMVRFLEELTETSGQGLGGLETIYRELTLKPLLKFAVLLQSIGKEHGSSPCNNQRELLAVIAERLQLTAFELETLSFLIENQNEMIETALHQDIHQPAIIQSFGKRVKTEDHLKMLYLMSYADLRAVAPGTWTSWKNLLLSELYHRTLQYLQRPESLNEEHQATRDGVHQALHCEVPVQEIEDHFSQLPEDYLISTRSEEVALHIRLIRSMKEKPFTLHHEFNEAGRFHNVTLCCQARLEAFKKLVAILTSKNLNILGARIFLKKDGVVIITIHVAETKDEPHNPAIWKDVKQKFGEVLEEKIDLRALFASRTRYVVKRGPLTPIIPRIQIDNSAKAPFTIIRVEARDHLGMLYKIAKVLADSGIQIHRAKISTQGNRGIDVFYVSLNGKKIVFPKLIRRIKERLVHILLVEKLEDIA